MMVKCRKFPPIGARIRIYRRSRLIYIGRVTRTTPDNETVELEILSRTGDQTYPIGTRRWFCWALYVSSYKLYWEREWKGKRGRV